MPVGRTSDPTNGAPRSDSAFSLLGDEGAKWAASILNMEPPKTLKEVQSDSGTDSWQSALLPNDEEEGPRSI